MKKLNFLLVLLAGFVFTNHSFATVINVPGDYQTIQEAINTSMDGDTILVASGLYKENIDFMGKGILLTSNFIFSYNLEDIKTTIIDGSEPNNTDSASCVLMYKPDQSFSDDSSAALIGFTLTGGKGTAWEDEHNPGHYYREGGGILIQYWAPRIRFNIIRDNEAYDKTGLTSAGGGAIRCGDGNPLIENNIILHNRGRYGGGIVFNYSGGVIRNNIIAENYGGEDYAGGGVWILGTRFDGKIKVIENNTIINNSSVLPGGGIFLWASNLNYLRNNIIWGNFAPSFAQIRISGGSSEIIYNDVEGGFAGEGNVDLFPEFDAQGYYLSDISPCIDAGKDSVVFNDREDPANPGFGLYPSKGTVRNDMGVFGGPNCSDLPQIVTSIGNDVLGNIPDKFQLFQNYPNPFNPTTNIQFSIPKKSYVELEIFNALGESVDVLVSKELSAGTYNFDWNAYNLTSGIYFYRLEATDYVETRKMILVK